MITDKMKALLREQCETEAEYQSRLADIQAGLRRIKKREPKLFEELKVEMASDEIKWADPFGWKEEPYFRWELVWFYFEKDSRARYYGLTRECKYLPNQTPKQREIVKGRRFKEEKEAERLEQEKWEREHPFEAAAQKVVAAGRAVARAEAEAAKTRNAAARATKIRRRALQQAREKLNSARQAQASVLYHLRTSDLMGTAERASLQSVIENLEAARKELAALENKNV
jgi:hypothetical protein